VNWLTTLLLGLAFAPASPAADYATGDRWWPVGEGREMPKELRHPNEAGAVTTLNANGPIATQGHAFFTPLGSNGRACVSCHQPADAMSLSVQTIRERWQATQGKDPLFAPIDGANCPNLPQGEEASHSLLLKQGLFRIARPWPPQDAAGHVIKPEFSIEVVRDATGCNTDTTYGLKSSTPTISVFRRPRPVANLKYILAAGFPFDPKNGLPLRRDPQTGEYMSGNLLSDGRALTLPAQMVDAMRSHLQTNGNPTPEQLKQILDFEQQVYSAQSHDKWDAALTEGGAEGGPEALFKSRAGMLQNAQRAPIWKEFLPWKTSTSATSPEQQKFRESVARGAELFVKRMFLISGSTGINSMGFGSPVLNSCAMCHNMQSVGIDVAPGQVDLGTTNDPWAKPAPELPLFKLTCNANVKPHPFLGRVVHTQDPGYALTTGRCEDIGKITMQSMRGLAARAPYFSNGSAKTLREIVEIYNRRYGIRFTDQEIDDLTNLMSVL
jgi:hypothetical protein